MRKLFCFFVAFFIAVGVSYSNDAFPKGQATPEGVACDMARAFIDADKVLWLSINNQKLINGSARFKSFFDGKAQEMDEMSKIKSEERPGPRRIIKVYKARYLSMNGPASYGYAFFDLKEVMFVDIVVVLSDKSEYLNRTLVVQDSDGLWYVVPDPGSFPLLSSGLNSESASTEALN